MLQCKFCGRSCKNKNSLSQHQIRCKFNKNKIKLPDKSGKNNPMYGKRSSNQFIKAKENGDIFVVSDQTKAKISESSKRQLWDEDRRKAHSIRMQKVVRDNPDAYSKNNVCGRVKITEYKPGINLKGTWEVKVAEWLDDQNIKWENEANPQPYFWDGKWKLYFPDFYLPEYNCYIEVKGYRTERDLAKWNYFEGILLIFEKEIIDKIDEFNIEYVLEKFKWD